MYTILFSICSKKTDLDTLQLIQYYLVSALRKLMSGSISLSVLRVKSTWLAEMSDRLVDLLFHKDENEMLFSGSPHNTNVVNTSCRGFKTA